MIYMSKVRKCSDLFMSAIKYLEWRCKTAKVQNDKIDKITA